MPRDLIDLLWRDSPLAPPPRRRGPRATHTTGDVVAQAIALADEGGLTAVTIRAVAESLGLTTMSVYTHVNGRDDLLVLMADRAHAEMEPPAFGRARWRTRVRRVAEAHLELLRARPWLLGVDDPRTALGPGTIAKYDHELHAFDDTGLDDLDRDAALAFVLDFARSTASRMAQASAAVDMAEEWERSAPSLATYLGTDLALAQRVGRAAGESMQGPYDAHRAWEWGLTRVIGGLAEIIEDS
ncbi:MULTISPECIES: TetR/AcrR family transcriptional regulator [Aeromicrobium]|uniref:TetR/AcrR family transcriptional regulator n=1 Tax=Aeromicrobium TaxID=2040 RepID=UPI00257CA4E0|nr:MULTISPECIES: TetR/AcrR family transcriptional regulator C-terminal domain-containing protein [Aeromicrobium]